MFDANIAGFGSWMELCKEDKKEEIKKNIKCAGGGIGGGTRV